MKYLLLVLLFGCVRQSEINDISKDLSDINGDLHKIDKKLECMSKMMETNFRPLIPKSCKDKVCIRKVIDNWYDNCLKGKE